MRAPAIALTGSGMLAAAGLAVVGVLGYVLWTRRGAIAEGAKAAAAVVNPADSRNVVNRAVTAAGTAATGNESWTLGGQLAELFSPAVRRANDSVRALPVTDTGDEVRRLLRRYPDVNGTTSADAVFSPYPIRSPEEQ